MKKTLSLLISAALALSLAGCAEKGAETTTTTTTATAAETAPDGGAASQPAAATTTIEASETTAHSSSAPSPFTDSEVNATEATLVEVTSPAHDAVSEQDSGVSVYCDEEPTVNSSSVKIIVNNSSDKAVEIESAFTLERLNKGLWVSQKLNNLPAGTTTLDAGKECTVELTADMLAEPLKMGYYRIGVTVDGTQQRPEFFVNGEAEPFSEDDVIVNLSDGDKITTDTKSVELHYQYVGDADYAEYCFGCEFALEKQLDGDWKKVEFADNAGFNDLGYLIGTESPLQSTEVYLGADFYKQPLTAGQYRIVKNVCGITYYVTFEMVDFSDIPASPDGYEIYDGEGSMTLVIEKIEGDEYTCRLPWPYPAEYCVDLSGLGNASEKFCVNDTIEVAYSCMYQISEWEFQLIAASVDTSSFQLDETVAYKPVIYLYPTETTAVDVKLYYNGELTVTYPQYDESKSGWTVTAEPDGTLWQGENEYSYLFWEGKGVADYDFSKGFCVNGGDTAEFLREKLAQLGLTAKEYNEFIVYWLPLMQDNEYNIITFQTDRYTENAVLDVTPKPDSVLRVFMAYKAADEYTEIAPQTLTTTARTGFTVVEWGGTEVK